MDTLNHRIKESSFKEKNGELLTSDEDYAISDFDAKAYKDVLKILRFLNNFGSIQKKIKKKWTDNDKEKFR